MPFKLINTSLLYAFFLVTGATIVGVVFDGTFVSAVGFLLAPGIWTVYGLSDVNSHDLLPFVGAQLVNILLYAALIAAFLGLSRTGRGEGAEDVPRR